MNSEEGGIGGTTPVGKYSPAGNSPYGLADMSGNVWEQCADWYGEKEYQRRKDSVVDPQGPKTGTYRVLRGGSYILNGGDARCVVRSWYHYPLGNYGFRVAAVPL